MGLRIVCIVSGAVRIRGQPVTLVYCEVSLDTSGISISVVLDMADIDCLYCRCRCSFMPSSTGLLKHIAGRHHLLLCGRRHLRCLPPQSSTLSLRQVFTLAHPIVTSYRLLHGYESCLMIHFIMPACSN